jgi:hypothetical protein
MPNSAHSFTVTYGRQTADEEPTDIKSINVKAETMAHAAWEASRLASHEGQGRQVLVDVVQLS